MLDLSTEKEHPAACMRNSFFGQRGLRATLGFTDFRVQSFGFSSLGFLSLGFGAPSSGLTV